ncbi:MAG: carbohydrate-binding protein [Planctomycetota bacterium]
MAKSSQPPIGKAHLEELELRQLFSSTLQWQPLGELGNGGRSDAIAVSPYDSDHLLVSGDVLGSAVSFDAGQAWEPATGFDSLEHSDFTFHPTDTSEVWAATLSGPYRSTDGGRTWESRRLGMPPAGGFGYDAAVEKVLYDLSDSTHQTLLAFGGDHRELKEGAAINTQLINYGKVWRSTNGGLNWSDIEMADLPGNITAVTYEAGSSDVLIAAVSDDGIYRSTGDGPGATWQRRSNGLPTAGSGVRISGIVSDPAKPWIYTATVGTRQGGNANAPKVGGIYRSTDRGWNWTRVEAGEQSGVWPPDFRHVAVSSNGGTLWATDVTFGNGKGVYKSIDSGATWDHVLTRDNEDQLLIESSPLNDDTSVGGWWVEIDPSDDNTVYVLGSGVILKTTDGGQTWTDETNISFGDNTWRSNGYTGWVAENVEFNPFDSDMIVTQGLDYLLAAISRDGGFSWDAGFRNDGDTGLPAFNGARDVAFGVNGVLFVALGQGPNTDELLARSTDNGVTWDLINPPVVTGSVATAVYANPSSPNIVWAVVDGMLYRSSNALASNPANVVWSSQNVDGSTVDDIAPVHGQDNHFYVSTNNGVYKTTTGGMQFTRVGGSGFAGPDDRVNLAVDPNNPNVVWAASIGNQSNGLYKFDGSSWQTLSLPGGADRWARDVAVDPTNSQRVVVATGQDPFVEINGGTFLWFTEDGGQTWRQESANLPAMRFRTVEFAPDGSRVIAGSGGRGFFVAELNRTTIGLQAEHMTLGESGGTSFDVGFDAEANGGRYIAVPTIAGNNWAASGDAPVAKFFFTLDQPEQGVTFRARVQTPNGDNSFFVRVDGGAWTPWLASTTGSGWAWDTVTNKNTGQTLSLDLAAGRHVLEFKMRESGTRLDEVELVLSGNAGDTGESSDTGVRIEAELADQAVGTQVVNGSKVGFINTGDYLVFQNVDFGSAAFTTFRTRAASATQGGTIELRIGSPTGIVAGSVTYSNTGGWDAWQTRSSGLFGIYGTHDVYLTFTGPGSGFLLDLDYFELLA